MSGVMIETREAESLAGRLDDLAALRIAIFREWPYLYEGSIEYEREYLATYLGNPRARIVTAEEGSRLVGISTCLPLADELGSFQQPMREAGFDPEKGFYFGESVLLPAYRGRGIGRGFMERRLAAARNHGGMEFCCFCAVRRAADDPRRPAGYRPLNGFWRKMGFAPLAGVGAEFEWREVGSRDESSHLMDFWVRQLAAKENP